jgi:hypothetical protein
MKETPMGYLKRKAYDSAKVAGGIAIGLIPFIDMACATNNSKVSTDPQSLSRPDKKPKPHRPIFSRLYSTERNSPTLGERRDLNKDTIDDVFVGPTDYKDPYVTIRVLNTMNDGAIRLNYQDSTHFSVNIRGKASHYPGLAEIGKEIGKSQFEEFQRLYPILSWVNDSRNRNTRAARYDNDWRKVTGTEAQIKGGFVRVFKYHGEAVKGHMRIDYSDKDGKFIGGCIKDPKGKTVYEVVQSEEGIKVMTNKLNLDKPKVSTIPKR